MGLFSGRREFVVVTPAPPEGPRPTAEGLGNVTDAHRNLLSRLTPNTEAAWSTRALWACLEELRTSVTTEAAHVRVHDAWTDGPAAFCIVYAPPYQPDDQVGLRRHVDDPNVLSDVGRSSELFEHFGDKRPETSGTTPDPVAFGSAVANFDVGEPLGTYNDLLRRDVRGIGWWGSIDGELPKVPSP